MQVRLVQASGGRKHARLSACRENRANLYRLAGVSPCSVENKRFDSSEKAMGSSAETGKIRFRWYHARRRPSRA